MDVYIVERDDNLLGIFTGDITVGVLMQVAEGERYCDGQWREMREGEGDYMLYWGGEIVATIMKADVKENPSK